MVNDAKLREATKALNEALREIMGKRCPVANGPCLYPVTCTDCIGFYKCLKHKAPVM